MRELVAHHGCLPLPNFTTRPLRTKEVERIWISPEALDSAQAAGQVSFVNHVLGYRYGALQRDVLAARESRDAILFDIFPTYIEKLAFAYAGLVFVLPESVQQLARQLRNSGRSSRISTLDTEMEELEVALRQYSCRANVLKITNKEGCLQAAVAEIALFISEMLV
jgi:guanylate kinase